MFDERRNSQAADARCFGDLGGSPADNEAHFGRQAADRTVPQANGGADKFPLRLSDGQANSVPLGLVSASATVEGLEQTRRTERLNASPGPRRRPRGV